MREKTPQCCDSKMSNSLLMKKISKRNVKNVKRCKHTWKLCHYNYSSSQTDVFALLLTLHATFNNQNNNIFYLERNALYTLKKISKRCIIQQL